MNNIFTTKVGIIWPCIGLRYEFYRSLPCVDHVIAGLKERYKVPVRAVNVVEDPGQRLCLECPSDF